MSTNKDSSLGEGMMIVKPHKNFDLKEITIVIKPADDHDKWFTMESQTIRSPLDYLGDAQECGEMFGKWLKNSIEVMKENNAKEIRITARWFAKDQD